MSFVHVGLISDGGGLWYLPRLVGPHRAKELFFLGQALSAEQARDWGIVNRIVPLADLTESVSELAGQLARRPRRALAQAKRLAAQAPSLSLLELMRQEQIAQTVLAASRDHQEGVRAFIEKRPAVFDE
jgi:2-(1,2-epoxy-1,2-dihydrophenyl)acetyl-CoA isomerase